MSILNSKVSVLDEILDLDLLDFKLSNLSDLIPFLSQLKDKKIIIKCGEKHIIDNEAMMSMCKDIAVLSHFGAKVVLVHGGGPELGEMLEQFGAKNEVIDSHRVADDKVLDIAQMVLCGKIGPRLVDYLVKAGACGVSISGKDGNLIISDKLRRVKRDPGSNIERILSLGMVGEPHSLNKNLICAMFDSKIIPVVSPIGISLSGLSYILNADSVATFVASSLNADKLIFLSDENGIVDSSGNLLSTVSSDMLKSMAREGMVDKNMMFKCECAILAIKNSVKSVYIYNGSKKHAALLDLFGHGSEGTMIHGAAQQV